MHEERGNVITLIIDKDHVHSEVGHLTSNAAEIKYTYNKVYA